MRGRKLFWSLIIFIVLGIFENTMTLGAEIEGGPAWKLSIAVPESNEVREIQLNPTEHFHVVLENRSKKPQKIWKNSNSWGYSVLYFEVTDENGMKQIIRKQPRDWRKNTPGYWLLSHGEYLVYNISLSSRDWGFTLPLRGEPRRLKIQAIIDIPEESQARKLGVWTGLIKSVVYEIDIWE